MGVIILDFIPLKNTGGESGVRRLSLYILIFLSQETIYGRERKKELYPQYQECWRNIEIQSL